VTPLPPPLGGGEIRFWRLDAEHHAETWASGEGAFRVGGRWNSPGRRTVYAALDPATALLEVAVHKGFQVLDTQPHRLTHARIIDPGAILIVRPEDVPNPHWLSPGTPNSNQQRFGDDLTRRHRFVLIPSVVSRHSWNLIFDAGAAAGGYDDVTSERFALDPRLQV
jgi:RES domain-containing protein